MFVGISASHGKCALGLPITILQGNMRLEAAAWKIAFYRSPSGIKPLLLVCIYYMYVHRHILCMFL